MDLEYDRIGRNEGGVVVSGNDTLTETLRQVTHHLPAAHEGRVHALRLVRSLGSSAYQPYPEMLHSAAWHFATWCLAQDPRGLFIQASGHGPHEDLEIHSQDWSRVVCLTLTSGVRAATGLENSDFVEDFLFRRQTEERRLGRALAGGHPDEEHPAVSAALVIRAATDPMLGWTAEPADPESTEPRWVLVDPVRGPRLVIDIARGSIESPNGQTVCDAGRIAGSLTDPLDRLEETHRSLRDLAAAAESAPVGRGRRVRPPTGASGSETALPDRVLHADWAIAPAKRWVATASRNGDGWSVDEVARWSDDHGRLLVSDSTSVLAGFDFPIGVPLAYARKAGISDFPRLLTLLGVVEPWTEFFEVCSEPGDISPARPFYPRSAPPGSQRRRADLENALGLSYGELLRRCERRTPTRGEASSLFWLIGAKQVGRAAITGWREVIGPATRRGAALWPFDGDLHDLLEKSSIVLAETYPAEFYGHLGFPAAGWSKRSQGDRQRMGRIALEWAGSHGICVAAEVMQQASDGFGPKPDGEDPFDAFVGALGMLEVLLNGSAPLPEDDGVRSVEGWILGQEA